MLGSSVLSGSLAGLAGALLIAQNGNATPQPGADLTLTAISAAFLGATAIRPGRFNVVGTLIAIFFLAFSINGLTLLGVDAWINDVFTGAALVIAVAVARSWAAAPGTHENDSDLAASLATMTAVPSKARRRRALCRRARRMREAPRRTGDVNEAALLEAARELLLKASSRTLRFAR